MKHTIFSKWAARCAAATAVLGLASPWALAVGPNTYQSSPNGGIYAASASFNGVSSPAYTVDIASSSPLHPLVMNAQGFYLSIQDSLNNAILTGIGTGQGGNVSMPYPGLVAGTLAVSVSGLPNGNLAVNIGGLYYSTLLTASGSAWGGLINASCVVTIKLLDINFSAEYNPYTGAITNATQTFTPQQTTECQSNFSLIPVIGPYIDNKLIERANGLSTVLAGYSGAVLNIQPQQALLGFVNSINPNTYMVGSIDAGMYLRNNIQSLFTGKQITLQIRQPASFHAPTYKNSTPGPSQYTGNAFSVEFFDNGVSVAGFKVQETRYFLWTVVGGEEP